MHKKGYSATVLLAMLNVHTTVIVLLLNYYLLHAGTTIVRGTAGVLGACCVYQIPIHTCAVQQYCTRKKCAGNMRTRTLHDNIFGATSRELLFTLFTPFCTIPFSKHTIVSMIVIFVCAVESLFVVLQLVEKWHEEMKVCVFGRLGTRMCTAQSLPQYTMVLPVPVPRSARATTAVLSSSVVDFALCSFHAKLHIA